MLTVVWDSDARTRRDHLTWLVTCEGELDLALVLAVTDALNVAGWHACALATASDVTYLRTGPRGPCPVDRWLAHLGCRWTRVEHRRAAAEVLRRLPRESLERIVTYAITAPALRAVAKEIIDALL